MLVSAEMTELKSEVNYLVDALKLALSISPNSIPCDSSLGIEMKRVSDFEDVTRYKVMKLMNRVDPNKRLVCDSCYLSGDKVYINTRFKNEGSLFRFII